MGIFITIQDAPTSSGFNQWKLYRSTSRTGTFSLITTQALTDLTYYDEDGSSTSWYKTSYYNSSTSEESAYSVPLKGMSNTYTTVAKVVSFLNLPTISDSTSVTTQDIQELISRHEDEIDHRTGHAWRERYSETQTGQDTDPDYEMHDLHMSYEYLSGRPVYLGHRAIKQLDSDYGDAFDFWNGGEWENWLTTKTEGRADDYWLDYRRGILFIKWMWGGNRPASIRIKYRYGETHVNKMIEDICTKMVAIDLISVLDRTTLLPAGTDQVNLTSKMEFWKRDIDEKLSMITEIKLPMNIL